MLSLSVVIITWNAERDVKPCLDSVVEATGHLAAEIIVIDNGSNDNTRSLLQSYGERINLILLEKNYGVAAARNIGMRKATGAFVLILDIDTVVNKEAIDGMLDYLSNRPECGLCACKLQSEAGEVQDSCRRLPYPAHKIRNLITGKTGKFAFLSSLHNKIKEQNEKQFYHEELQANEPFEVEYVIGACQMFRSMLLSEVGYLDEKIFYGPEDADFCLRICQHGYKIVCLPAYHIVHHYNRISNRRVFSKMSYLHAKGLLYFYFKHSSIAQPKHLQSHRQF